MKHINLENMIEQEELQKYPECINCLHPHKDHILIFVEYNNITRDGHYELRCPLKYIKGYCYATD